MVVIWVEVSESVIGLVGISPLSIKTFGASSVGSSRWLSSVLAGSGNTTSVSTPGIGVMTGAEVSVAKGSA